MDKTTHSDAAGERVNDPARVDRSGSTRPSDDDVPDPEVKEYQTTTEEADIDTVWPTEEELVTLRRVPDKIPIKIYTIAYVEMVERLSYYGCTQVFTNFIQQPAPTASGACANPNSDECQPGGYGLGQQASTGLTTFNSFWNYFTPLAGAWVRVLLL